MCRLAIDALPPKIRNSKLLFKLLALILRENKFLYEFRSFYDQNPDFDLSLLYHSRSMYYSKSFSGETDCNSKHRDILIKYLLDTRPRSLLDVGSGSGYLLNLIRKKTDIPRLVGIDINCSAARHGISSSENILLINSEIEEHLSSISDSQFDVTVCSHVIEHLKNPNHIISEMRRISAKSAIFVVPLEKKFKWGLNYHVHFFEKPRDFLRLVTYSPQKSAETIVFERLGDLLYIEEYKDAQPSCFPI